MKRKILLLLIAFCCILQPLAMASPECEQTPPESPGAQIGDRTEPDYFTITATSDNTVIGLTIYGSPNIGTLQYCYDDGVTWTNITVTTTFDTLQNEQCIKFRSMNQMSNSSSNYIQFKSTEGSFKVSGNINTLVNYQNADNTNIESYAFYQLFSNCERLTDASALSLPTKTLASYCYQNMFSGCTSLTEAPELFGTNLVDACYTKMFYGCISLNSVTTHATTWSTYYAGEWLSDVSFTGSFHNVGGANIPMGIHGIPIGWTEYNSEPIRITASANHTNSGTISGSGPYPHGEICTLTASPRTGYTFVNWTENDEIVSTNAEYSFSVETDRNLVANFETAYFCLTALEDYTTIGLTVNGSPDISTLQYSYNGENWINITSTITFNTLQNGQYIMFRSENQVSYINSDYIQFKDTGGSYMVSGNIKTLLNYNDVDNTLMGSFAFKNLFSGCTGLKDASNLSLPDKILATCCYQYMFFNCTSLTEAPELPATTLAKQCYDGMFDGCTSLTKAPELPATTLASLCYHSMFSYCSSLIEAPVLPATILESSCYECMFFGCTSLIETPELPATILNQNCYCEMFYDCTSLIHVQKLPATTLAIECYSEMFYGCSSLTEATELPATTLTAGCYDNMFNGCTSLTKAPDLPATTLADYCYKEMFKDCSSLETTPSLQAIPLASYCYSGMFSGCTKLNSVVTYATTWNSSNTTNWLYGVSSTGNFYNLGGTDIPTGTDGIPSGWKKLKAIANNTDYGKISACGDGSIATLTAIPNSGNHTFVNWTENEEIVSTDASYTFTVMNDRNLVANFENAIDYLTLTAISDNTIIGLQVSNSPDISTLQYSYNGTEWVNITNTITFKTLKSGEFIKFRSENQITSSSSSCIYFEDFGGSYNASGNINTMINYKNVDDVVLTVNSFALLFNRCTRLINAKNLYLPAETLAVSCYSAMFLGCTSLTTAPNLPATTLAPGCYINMFYGCTSLKAAPKLPAKTLASSCYKGMFNGCTSLETTPELPATILGSSCYCEMYKNCTSLKAAPKLPATTLEQYCYQCMFENCTSLETPPIKLSATTLPKYCYFGMFRHCSSLITAPKISAITLKYMCCSSMFAGCSSLKAAPELTAMTLAESCYYEMFINCTSLETVPDLPATTLKQECYKDMFYGCTKLKTAPKISATRLYYKSCSEMFYNCTSLETAQKLPAPGLAKYCYDKMFYGCTSLITPPELPAEILEQECYLQMFYGCTKLETAPELPATRLQASCYQEMFSGCTSLKNVPELPATRLGSSCYLEMFKNCSSLEVAPELFATTLDNMSGYNKMFYGCTRLNTVITHATTWNSSYASSWLYGVSPTGNFYNLGGADIPTGSSGIPTGWTEHTTAPFRITASTNDTDFGTVSGAGFYPSGYDCTLTAIPNPGYTFINWTEDNVEVSTDAQYSFTVSVDRTLVANFEPAYTFTGSDSWTDPSNWRASDGTTPATMPDLANENVVIDGMAFIHNETSANVKSLTINTDKKLEINSEASLTVSGAVNTTNVNQLILNDGGQIFQTNENVKATFKKNIVNPSNWNGNQKDGWQSISSPIKNTTIASFISQDTNYDLYVWDGKNGETPWVNYKAHVGHEDDYQSYFNGNFYQGVGYLASYESVTTANFSGNLNNGNTFNFEVEYDESWPWKLFLLGNPFTFDIEWSELSKTNVTNGYVTLDPSTGSYEYHATGSIKVGEGFFVQTTGQNPSLEYNANSKSERDNSNNINVIVSNSKGRDNAILSFNGSENEGFSKLENFNESIATIFTVSDDKMYGISNYDNDIKEIPLCFKAKEIGTYTISMKPNGDFNYIHLIDRMTGTDTDMLLDGEYKFNALSSDNVNRFIVRLSDPNQDPNPNPNCFAYQSDGMLYINEFGSIQIVDMTGRVVINEKLSGNSIDISRLENAAYIVRLVNENGVKTQKIVVL